MSAKTVGAGDEELYLRDRDEIIKLVCLDCEEEIEWECVSLHCPEEKGRYVIDGQYEEVFLRLPETRCSGITIATTEPVEEETTLVDLSAGVCSAAIDVSNRTTYELEV